MVSLALAKRYAERLEPTGAVVSVCELHLEQFSSAAKMGPLGSIPDPLCIRLGIVRMSKARTDMNAEDKGLGQTIAAWFASNGWAQTFLEQWAKSYGVKGPHASQIAFLKQRKLDPAPASSRPWRVQPCGG